jgi:hypothetical protein
MICASLYRPFFIVNLLRYHAEKILLLNTTNFRGDYQEANKKVHSQRPGKDEWDLHIRVLRKINDLDEATIIDRELRELSHGEIPEHLLHLVRRKGVADQDEDLE